MEGMLEFPISVMVTIQDTPKQGIQDTASPPGGPLPQGVAPTLSFPDKTKSLVLLLPLLFPKLGAEAGWVSQ